MQMMQSAVPCPERCRSRSANHSICKTVLYKAVRSADRALGGNQRLGRLSCSPSATPFQKWRGRTNSFLRPTPSHATHTLPGVTFMTATTSSDYLLLREINTHTKKNPNCMNINSVPFMEPKIRSRLQKMFGSSTVFWASRIQSTLSHPVCP